MPPRVVRPLRASDLGSRCGEEIYRAPKKSEPELDKKLQQAGLEELQTAKLALAKPHKKN